MNAYNDTEDRRILSENLQRYIKSSGKEQKDIAIDIEENPPTFNQWVTGKAYPKMSRIRRLAAYFGIDVVDLIEDSSMDKKRFVNLSMEETLLVNAYRSASEETKTNICKILDIRR